MNNFGSIIATTKRIKTVSELDSIQLGKEYVFVDANNDLVYAVIESCDCGKKFYINAVNITGGISRIGFETLDIDEATYDPDTDKCMYCPE